MKLCASRCAACGHLAFPPRPDCPKCLGGESRAVELSGRAIVYSFTTIHSAPAGFEAPYVIALAELEEGGRVMATFARGIREQEVSIGMPVEVITNGEIFELRI
jgi:uncharacterized protein